jgi:hypothetical protein
LKVLELDTSWNPLKIYFMHQKVDQLQTFNELNDKANVIGQLS